MGAIKQMRRQSQNVQVSAHTQTHTQKSIGAPNPRAHRGPIRRQSERAADGPGGGYNPPGIAREYHTVIAKNIRDGS